MDVGKFGVTSGHRLYTYEEVAEFEGRRVRRKGRGIACREAGSEARCEEYSRWKQMPGGKRASLTEKVEVRVTRNLVWDTA